MKNLNLLLTGIFVISVLLTSAQDKVFDSNLPIVFVNTNGTEIPDEPKITAELGIVWNENGESNNTHDPHNHFNGKIGIEIRGSSSQMFPKKSFGFELRDEQDEGIDFPLLGMPEEEDWILYAPYSDKTLIRNVLTYSLASQLGAYTPRCRFVELFINNEYWGVYVLMEKIKRDKNRVDISKLKEEDISGEDVTGGYIIKVDKTTGSGGDGWYSDFENANGAKTFYQYEYPKQKDIAPEQKEYIQNYVNDFETAVYNNEHDDENDFRNFMNEESFFDCVIMNELSKNVDGYRLSTYLYKDKNEKLTAGPLWDYNLSFGNANYYEGWETSGLSVHAYIDDDDWQVPFWWKKLMNDDYFTIPFKCRWEFLREYELSDERVFELADSLISHMGDAVGRNFERWPILGEWIWPNYFVGNDYESEVAWMSDWTRERLRHLDYILPGTCGEDPGMPPPEFSFDIYPNPFTSKLNIQITSDVNLSYQFQLYNINGQLVESINFHVIEGGNSFAINTIELRAGMYIYRLKKGNAAVEVGKVVKL